MDDALRARYETKTRQEIADEFGLTEGQVRSRFYTLGMASKVIPWPEADIKRLRDAYESATLNPDLCLPALAASLGRDKANVSRKARSLGLTQIARKRVLVRADAPTYSTPEEEHAARSESAKRWIAERGHPRGALGMRHTKEVKAVITEKSRARWSAMTEEQKGDQILKAVQAKRALGNPIPNVRGKWKAAWREIGSTRHFYRSRWEANYARYLEWLCSVGQIMKWEHEPHTFWFEGIKRGVVSYLPDFRVTEANGDVHWHEVKGWMDARSKTTISRMAKYHPKEVLIVIGEKQYKEIGQKVSALIPGWET